MATRLVSRAVNGLQIRQHGDVYQVVQAPVRPTTQPLFTSRDLARAEEWRQQRAVGPGRPARAGSAATKRLPVRFTDDEIERVGAAASSYSQTVSAYVRARLGL